MDCIIIIIFNLIKKFNKPSAIIVDICCCSSVLNCGGLLEILLAIILPPIGVLLHNGCSNQFFICILLTILGYIPGIIYALFVICNAPKTVANPGVSVGAGNVGAGATV